MWREVAVGSNLLHAGVLHQHNLICVREEACLIQRYDTCLVGQNPEDTFVEDFVPDLCIQGGKWIIKEINISVHVHSSSD